MKQTSRGSRYNEVEYYSQRIQLVEDRYSHRTYIKKVLDVYSIPVFFWLQSHLNMHLPRIIEYWQDGNKLNVIEEVIQGDTLEVLLQQHSLDEKTKRDIVVQICDALIMLHRASPAIIHRDIKASNIMVKHDGTAVLIDYDAAKTYCRKESRDTVLIGTEGSAAPEQYGFMASDVRTDIYAMGVLILEMFPDDARMKRIGGTASAFSPSARYQSAFLLKAAVLKIDHFWVRFFSLPGFQTGNAVHMCIGALWYFAIVYEFIKNMGSTSAEFKSSAAVLAAFLGLTDLYGDWLGLFEWVPFLHDERMPMRVFGMVIGFWAVMFAAAVLSIILTALPV